MVGFSFLVVCTSGSVSRSRYSDSDGRLPFAQTVLSDDGSDVRKAKNARDIGIFQVNSLYTGY